MAKSRKRKKPAKKRRPPLKVNASFEEILQLAASPKKVQPEGIYRTYYTDVNWPSATGLFSTQIEYLVRKSESSDLFEFEIDAVYILEEIGGVNRYEILKSKSLFRLNRKQPLTEEQAVSYFKNATHALRHRLQSDKPDNIDTHLVSFADPELQDIRDQVQELIRLYYS